MLAECVYQHSILHGRSLRDEATMSARCTQHAHKHTLHREETLKSLTIMKSSKRKGDTSKEFSSYFERTYSNGRWLTSLLPSLSKELPDVALQNMFSRDSIETAAWNRVHSSASGRLQCFRYRASHGECASHSHPPSGLGKMSQFCCPNIGPELDLHASAT